MGVHAGTVREPVQLHASPPGPQPRVPGASTLAYFRDPIGFLDDVATYGPVAKFTLRSEDIYLISDPELIRQVLAGDHRLFTKSSTMQETRRVVGNGLLTSEGEYHHSQRRLVQPGFHPQRVAALGATMAAVAGSVTSEWSDGEQLDLQREMGKMTVRVVGETLFSVDLAGDVDRIVDTLPYAVLVAGRMGLPFAKAWERSPLPSARRFERAVAALRGATADIVTRRRALEDPPDDLLGLLLAGRTDGVPLTDDELQDEVATLLLAGHETTATLLTWTLTLLSRHPEVRAQVEAEVDAVLNGRLPSVDDLPRLDLTHRVLREALRLYPPVWAIGRRSTAEYTLAGYEIPEGSIFLLSPYLVHRDPRHFAHPSSFDPSRWEPEEEAARPRYASFPFGGGPRQCPGADFALLEARLLLATIVSRWQIEESPDKPARPAFLLVLRPRPGFDVRVRARDTALTSEAAPEEIAHVGVWQASPGQRLWRAHSDAVNSELVERWLPAGLGRVLKTDLWDEAVGGGLVPALRALAARIDAIDVAGEVAEAAQSHYPELGVTVADVRRMPFADETFDAVVSNSTLDHFGSAIEIKASLSEIARVLRPGGALVLTLDNPRNLLVAATKALPRTQLNRLWLRHSAVFGRLGLLPYQVGVTVGPRRLRRMLEWAGFEVELQEEIVHCPRLPAVVLGHVLETVGPAWSETAFTRLLAASERLGSLPLSGLTGNFVAVRARKL